MEFAPPHIVIDYHFPGWHPLKRPEYCGSEWILSRRDNHGIGCNHDIAADPEVSRVETVDICISSYHPVNTDPAIPAIQLIAKPAGGSKTIEVSLPPLLLAIKGL
jgi:hypothetical protein